MKRLIVFDVDDTLTLTMSVDEGLFVRAAQEVLGVENINTDWSAYRNVTDDGIITELIERQGRLVEQQEVRSVRDQFVTLLRSESCVAPDKFVEVPGAKRMLSKLRQHPDFECSLATGAWRESALIKLQAAGLDVDGVPLATCDDSPQREQIVEVSIQRARTQYHLPTDTPVTLVGDRPWDFQVASKLQLQFVGIGSGRQASRLRACGAKHVIEDFTDVDRFLGLAAQS